MSIPSCATGALYAVTLVVGLVLGGCAPVPSGTATHLPPDAPAASTANETTANETTAAPPRLEVTGFEPEWAPAALVDRDAEALDVIGVDGVLLTPDGAGVTPVTAALDKRRDRAHAHGLTAQLLVSNYDERIGDFSEPLARRMLGSPARRAAVVADLATAVTGGGWDSIMVDLESLNRSDTDALTAFCRELRAALGPDVRLDIALMASTTAKGYSAWGYDLPALAAELDHLVLMAYDQHGPWAPNDPGPIGALDWSEQALTVLLADVPPGQVVLGVAGYGYRWHGPHGAGEVSVAAARSIVEKAGRTATWREDAGEWTATLPHGQVLWWSDARSLDARVRLARDHRLAGVAVWSLDLADPIKPVN